MDIRERVESALPPEAKRMLVLGYVSHLYRSNG
jgi:hypothetical protein